MRLPSIVFASLFPLSLVVSGQTWELGGAAGYGLYRGASATSPALSGTAGFDPGFALSGVLGNDRFRYIGGDVRYTYLRNDLRISAGGTKATASGDSQALHYDVLFHATPRESSLRPYLAAGAGIKWFRGTGAEPAYQPLSNLVVLTHTNQAEPLISVGGGVKFALTSGTLLRLDLRDYLTPLPDKLLAAPPGTHLGGWINDFVFLVGISKVF
jgi:hypothetical protein